MKIKIRGGTARHDEPSLCLTCRSGKVVQGQSYQDQLVHCGQLEARVTFKVTSCTEYVHRQHPSLWQMEDIAWVLRTDPHRKQIGFVQSRKLPIVERHVLGDDE
jgi:hypothetical protein